MRKSILMGIGAAILSIGFAFFPSHVDAIDYISPEAHTYSGTSGNQIRSFYAFNKYFRGGGKVAIGDAHGDGKDEILIGAGKGGGPHVRLFNGEGSFLGYSFFPFHPDFRGGVDVDMADTDGDGKDEMIVSQLSNGQAWVKVYEINAERTIKAEFIAYGTGFEGGAHVAGCDIDGDGKAEIITGSGMGSSGHIRGFDGSGRYVGFDLFPFESSYRGGADVACGNVDGGAEEEVIVSKNIMDKAQVKVYKTDSTKRIIGDFYAFPEGHKEGANVTAGDMDNDGHDEVIVGTNGGGPQVRVFQPWGEFTGQAFMAYQDDFRGGVNVAYGNIDGIGGSETVTMPGRRVWEGRNVRKYVEVSLSKQRLYAYENGRKVKEFPISSGTWRYPTPIGDFSVQRKVVSTRMKWEYGPNDPNNYDLPNVPHSQFFNGPFALHGAYWHNNFGHPMSHGCINLPLHEAAWLYSWTNVGDRVFVRP
jgi:hypothetical protein